MDELKIRQQCKFVMENASDAYIATISDDGFPRISCVFNLRNKTRFPNVQQVFKNHEDDFMLYIGTDDPSQKVREIRKNPKIAVYLCIPEKFLGFCAVGEAEFVKDPQIKQQIWELDWTRYYPNGWDSPGRVIVRLRPKYLRGWLTPEVITLQLHK